MCVCEWGGGRISRGEFPKFLSDGGWGHKKELHGKISESTLKISGDKVTGFVNCKQTSSASCLLLQKGGVRAILGNNFSQLIRDGVLYIEMSTITR